MTVQKIQKQHVRDVKLDFHFAVKENLAKLLAEESIDVRVDSVPTASFDMRNRILTIPMWSGISNYLYDMLIVHEVGHARYTPASGWQDGIEALGKHIIEHYKIHFQQASVPSLDAAKSLAAHYINVTEDARIDRMQREKFPGTVRDYAVGSKELLSRGFFGKKADFSKMSFADRVNVYTKCSVHVPEIKFSDAETTIVTEIMNNNTWDDVVVSAKKMIEQQMDETAEQLKDRQAVIDQQEIMKQLLIETMKELDKHLNDISEKAGKAANGTSSEVGNFKIANQDSISAVEAVIVSADNYLRMMGNRYNVVPRVVQVHAKYKNYINGAVSRFDMYKAAADYLGRTEKKTGVIDTNRLHAHRYNEDVFYKSIIERKAKNHSIVIILDLSSSMAQYFHNVIEQTYAMVKFCRQVRIPYEVYMFSNGVSVNSNYGSVVTNPIEVLEVGGSKTTKKHNGERLALINIFSHKHPLSKEVSIFNRLLFESSGGSTIYGMSGTPLDSTVLMTHLLVKKLLNETRTEIPSVVFITDGDSNRFIANYNNTMMIRDGFDGKVYKLDAQKRPQTVVYLEMLKNRTGANLLNYFLCNARDGETIKKYIKEDYSYRDVEKNGGYKSYVGAGFDRVHVFDTRTAIMNQKTSVAMADAFAKHIADVIR